MKFAVTGMVTEALLPGSLICGALVLGTADIEPGWEERCRIPNETRKSEPPPNLSATASVLNVNAASRRYRSECRFAIAAGRINDDRRITAGSTSSTTPLRTSSFFVSRVSKAGVHFIALENIFVVLVEPRTHGIDDKPLSFGSFVGVLFDQFCFHGLKLLAAGCFHVAELHLEMSCIANFELSIVDTVAAWGRLFLLNSGRSRQVNLVVKIFAQILLF
mmetsp:Transcript_57203/g.107594  ORF Transcript_57203/g.107594 Transcript_57203/m.107594 type:complete len:219 (-) Transcript_57203:85-741(-)